MAKLNRPSLAIIAIAIMALALIGWVILQELRALQATAVERLRGQAQHITEEVSQSIDITRANLQAVVAMMEASGSVREAEFQAFIKTTQLFDLGPHLRAVALMPMLSPKQLPRLNSGIARNKIRRDALGYPDWSPIEPDGRDIYAPVVFAVSPNGIDQIVGFDLATSESRLTTALESRNSGEIRMTAPITLSQDQAAADQSVLLLGHTFRGRIGYRSLALPQDAYSTLIAVGYTPGAHLRAIFDTKNVAGFQITVSDVTEPGSNVRLFSSGATLQVPAIYQSRIDFAGRVWQIDYVIAPPALSSVFSTRIGWTLLLAAIMVGVCAYAGHRVVQNEATLERRVAERTAELQETQDQLNDALQVAEQANQAKTEFLATMSHELRTPLNAIIGFSDAMIQQVFGSIQPQIYRDYAGDIRQSGNHLLQLVNDVLDLSAIEAGALELKFAPHRPHDIVTDLRAVFNEVGAQKGIRFELDVPETLPEVWVDARAVKQVLLNLATNAVKFSDANTVVTVHADTDASTGSHPVTLAVTDQGHGIPPDKVDRILKPFIRGETDPHVSHDGAGLGLSIVSRFIAAHGGSLNITSALGVGTTVTFTLPAVSDRPAEEAHTR